MKKKHPTPQKKLKYILFSKNFSKNRHLLKSIIILGEKIGGGRGDCENSTSTVLFCIDSPQQERLQCKGWWWWSREGRRR